MEVFDKDGKFNPPQRVSVREAYILREMETGKTREQVLSEMAVQDENGAPF